MAETWEPTNHRSVYVRTGRNGQKIYKARWRYGDQVTSQSFKTLTAAADHLASVRVRRRAGDLPDPAKSRRTVDDLWTYFQENYTRRDTTLQRHRDAYEDHIAPVFGKRRLDTITTEEIERFYKRVETQKRKIEDEHGKVIRLIGGTVSTRRHVQETLHAVLRKAVKAGWLPKNPASNIERVHEPEDEVRWLTIPEVEKLVAAVEEFAPRFRLYVWMGVETAARPGELLALRTKHIDGSIRIREAVSEINGVRRIGPPKTKDSVRNVPISPRLRQELDTHFAAGYADRNDPEAFVFSVPEAQAPLTPTWLRKSIIQRAGRMVGLDWIVPYTLRHSGISLRLQQGLTDWEVAKITGTSPTMIRKTYGHIAEHELQEKLDRLASLG